MKNITQKKVLIFTPGTIGDTLLAVPALSHLCKKLRERGNEIHLYNSYPDTASAAHAQLFQNLDLFDKMRFVPVASKLWKDPIRRFTNVVTLRMEHYDVIIDIPCNEPDPLWMLKAFGAKKIYHDDGNIPKNYPRWKYLFDLFAQWGLPYSKDDLLFDWKFTLEEQQRADKWFASLNIPQNWTPFAMCTGGKCALQHWSLERYAEVLKEIVPQYHLFPVFFGGPADVKDAEFLIQSCGCGIFSKDTLTLREKILAMKKCRFYLGNNTGVMHLAGVAGLSGIGISSARDPEYYWQPLCEDLHLVTADVPCKGCRKTVCALPENESCIKRIPVYSILEILKGLVHGAEFLHSEKINSSSNAEIS